MKIIVAGSRDIAFVDIPSIVLKSDFTITELVSGGAKGVDTLGEQYARRRNIPIKRFLPNWEKYGKSAGPIRNGEMADYADGLIAVMRDESRGTHNMIRTATDKRLVVYMEGGIKGLTLDEAILEVERIRFLILKQGAMANKSTVETILILRHGMDEGQAREFTNAAEYKNLSLFRLNPLLWTTRDHPEPRIAHIPEILEFTPYRRIRNTDRGVFRLRRQFHEITLSYRVHTMLSEDATLIANSYSFLVPMNTVFTAAQLAEAIRKYSSHPKATYLVGVLETIATEEAK